MALFKMPSLSLSAMHLRNSLTYFSLRLKSDNTASSPTLSKQSQETRPKKPQNPYVRFVNERRGKIMSGLHKEAAKRWGEMDEEAKRPFVERYKTDIEIWKDERAIMKAQLEAMEEGDKRDAKDNPFYNGWTLFNSEVHIPGVTTSNFSKKASQMWNDLKTEEREAYHERARKINEKGQGDILASVI